MGTAVSRALVSSELQPSWKERLHLDTVLEAFLDKGMTEEDALMMPDLLESEARLYESGRITYGTPPLPILDLTWTEFKIRRLQDLLPKADKDDIITLFLALQRQCFTLGTI